MQANCLSAHLKVCPAGKSVLLYVRILRWLLGGIAILTPVVSRGIAFIVTNEDGCWNRQVLCAGVAHLHVLYLHVRPTVIRRQM